VLPPVPLPAAARAGGARAGCGQVDERSYPTV